MKAKIGRANIRAVVIGNGRGYVMAAIDHNGNYEYPQEKKMHTTARSVYADARQMYKQKNWDWDELDRSIKLD